MSTIEEQLNQVEMTPTFHMEHGICCMHWCHEWATHYFKASTDPAGRSPKVCETCADGLIVMAKRNWPDSDITWSKELISKE